MATIFLSKLKDAASKTRLISYPIKNINTFNLSYDFPVTPSPLPQNDDTQTILVKIEGNTTKISVDWVIKDEGSTNILVYDSSLSSPNDLFVNSSATTIWDQINFFDAIQPKSLNDVYMIEVADSLSNNVTVPATPYYQKIGFLTNLSLPITNNTPVTVEGHFDFIVGNVVTSFEAGTPSQPTGVSVTSGSTGHATLSFTAPSDNGGSSITDYQYFKKKSTGSYDNGTLEGATTSPITISGLTSGVYYTFKLQAKNANGVGLFSDEVSVKIL